MLQIRNQVFAGRWRVNFNFQLSSFTYYSKMNILEISEVKKVLSLDVKQWKLSLSLSPPFEFPDRGNSPPQLKIWVDFFWGVGFPKTLKKNEIFTYGASTYGV